MINATEGIEIAQLVADWLIRLPIRTCVKPPVTSDCSLASKLLFVDWLKILANEKQAVQFRSPLVLVCEQKRCSHESVCKAKGVKQWSSLLGMWSTTLRIHTLEDFVLVDIAEQPLFDLAVWNMYDQRLEIF